MRKKDILSTMHSCFNKALADEFIFELLGRDAAAPHAIRCWAQRRIALGLNKFDDAQITEASALADAMDTQRRVLFGRE